MLGVAQFYQELIAPHRGAARCRLRGRNVRCAAEPGAVPGRSRALPRRRQQLSPSPISSRTPTKFRRNSSRRSAFVRSPAGCSSRPIGAARPVSPSSMKLTRARISTGENPIGRRIAVSGAAGVRVVLRGGSSASAVVDEVEIVGVIPDIKQANLQDARAARGLRAAGAMDDAEDGDPRPRGDRRSRRADSGDSPRARGDGLHASRRVRRLLGRRRRVAGAAPARQLVVLVVFGLVSLTLAAVGTYGLISFSVNQRFNEIAVRSAFGAERGNLLKMFVTRALQLAGIGVVCRGRRRDRHAASRREPALRNQRARSVGARGSCR